MTHPPDDRRDSLAGAPQDREKAIGAGYVIGAYVLWGVLPLYFVALDPTGPWELVAWRVLFSFVLCVVLVLMTRKTTRIVAIARNRRTLLLTLLAGALIYVNWQVFILAALSGHVIETSLGYFITPILTMLLGVVVLRERLRRLQWAAVVVAAFAVAVIIVGYGSFPWISLVLALTFGFYGLVKKWLGPSVDAVSGLTYESFWLIPIAIVQLVLVGTGAGLTLGTVNAGHTAMLLLTGVVTAVPLLLFAAGTRRTSLVAVGVAQFIAPIAQFLVGSYVLHEPMPLERWAGFVIVWIAIVLFTIDLALAARRARA